MNGFHYSLEKMLLPRNSVHLIFHGMFKNEIMKFQVFFSSAKWFRTEFRAVLSSAKWFGTEF